MAYTLDDAFTKSLPVKRYGSRRGADVRLGIFHTAEGARTNESLAGWFNNPNAPAASSHAGADDTSLARLVPERYSAWTASKANPVATQIELCGFARWSAAEWRKHDRMLEFAARWAAAVSVYHNIPLVRLKPSQVRTGRGFCMHYDITVGWPTGSHTDCGSAFRDHIFDDVLVRARQIVAAGSHVAGATITESEEDELDDKQAAALARVDSLVQKIDKAVTAVAEEFATVKVAVGRVEATAGGVQAVVGGVRDRLEVALAGLRRVDINSARGADSSASAAVTAADIVEQVKALPKDSAQATLRALSLALQDEPAATEEGAK